MHVSNEVRNALDQGKAVVALESTIITHGMPWPENRDTAIAVEQRVRDAGAVPATIAILGGEIHIGLDAAAIEMLARADEVMKLSRADLASALARGSHGSTTVAATMILAERAGIEVFATGGIGGVHRGAATSFDISADLRELAQSRVHVVCAGAKAILDLPATLEVLETLGVPVVAWRQDELPAFWSRASGIAAPSRIDELDSLVRFIRARDELALGGGVLIANPVPANDEIPRAEMQGYIDTAIAESVAAGIGGKAVTPWLLQRIVEITGGRSLVTNRALIENNATLAAQLAVTLTI
ncbi:MAG: pseudouridine-5-phosphate glycosidase [Gammaproteobacteria bacterium]|nr:MAG: pseudouridine-5-phosphate glycosidase [Gammaproteobacteria bacterium]